MQKAGLKRFLLLRIWRDSLKQVCGYSVEKSIWNENNYITLRYIQGATQQQTSWEADHYITLHSGRDTAAEEADHYAIISRTYFRVLTGMSPYKVNTLRYCDF